MVNFQRILTHSEGEESRGVSSPFVMGGGDKKDTYMDSQGA